MTTRPIAVVTGATAGVGRATVRELATRGFDVALLARGAAGLEAAVGEVELAGGRAFAVPTDVSRFDEVDAAAGRIEEEFGPMDVWINNAMTTVFAPLAETGPADFQRAVEVTLLGQVWGTSAALARMRPRDSGVVVNVGSALAFVGIPLQAAYCASKFACRGFFESDTGGTAPRRKQRADEHGAPSGGEHAAVRLVQDVPAAPSQAGAADLPARSGGPAHRPVGSGR